ncbi:MAG: HEAT repeat domain-containing protein, partial [Planctomycetes bacterium]|nr:HEAT repeat domain-containing protein [Planctomycetota bacterium]
FMNDLEEVIDTLWLYSTHEEDPWTVDRAFQAIQPFGDAALEGLVWAVQQDDFNLRLLGLRVLREYNDPAVVALHAVANCIDSGNRIVRMTAIETAGLMRAGASSVVPWILPHLNSDDQLERAIAAGNLLRITGTEEASAVLRELMTNENAGVAMYAAFYLRESEWTEKPPEDWF